MSLVGREASEAILPGDGNTVEFEIGFSSDSQ